MMMYDELIKSLREDHGKQYFARDREAADAIEELQFTIKGLKAEKVCAIVEEKGRTLLKIIPKWIPVTERLPEEYGHYLANIVGGEFAQISWAEIVYFDGKIFRWEHISTEYPEKVTHWMPLPQPPKVDEDGVE